MAAKKIRSIPAMASLGTEIVALNEKRKVAAYARVSTDEDKQTNSYEAQIRFYTNYIQSHANWEFAGIYADEGISGTQREHRDGFNQMIEDALAGNIDLILTKSVSRFARNTVDSLSTIRLLKEHNVEVYFEKENIFSFDSKGEFMLTIMSSMAQEESRSISENISWGVRKKFEKGRYSLGGSRMLGYDKGENGKPVINKHQAKIVRLIFDLYLEGRNYTEIAKELRRRRYKTVTGQTKWSAASIRGILQNEKYKGDALLQKTYTESYLTHKSKTNHGEVTQYYVENGHEPIIDRETFDRVQAEIKRRSRRKKGIG